MKKTLSILLLLTLALSLFGCAKKETKPQGPVRVMTLSGTTGFGMAKLIADHTDGKAYGITVENDASAVTAALLNGSCDVAALPTNTASALYNKSGGAVQCLAVNTRGVLYLLGDAETSAASLADTAGETVYVPAQNPSFIFSALCAKAGVDAVPDDTYAQPADLRAALVAGEVHLAVLPEPLVTAALNANDSLRIIADLTQEWDRYFPAGSLVQGCVVVRTEFAKAYPDAVRQFLTDYKASVDLLTEDPDASAQNIVDAGLFAAAPVARAAIGRCNLCFLTGAEMKSAMSGYLEIMLNEAPASVGGSLPGDDFYLDLNGKG
jgi:NitT/TauT family transport system substrate-binding protein